MPGSRLKSALRQVWGCARQPGRGRVLGALLLAAALTGCSGSGTPEAAGSSDATTSGAPTVSASTSVTPPAPPPPPAPETGECRTLTSADTTVFTNETKPEPCSQPHTAYTFAVATLPASITFKGVQIQNASIQSAAADRCRAAFTAFIGGGPATRALSRLTYTYFLPDQKGFELGAHWVRCDVVARVAGKKLGELPPRVAHVLDKPDALATYGVCADGPPASAGNLVMCSQPHTYRALAAVRLGAADAPYPGKDTTLAQGKKQCQALIAHELGVTGGFTYTWTYPSSDDWASGQRFGYCWNATKR